MNKTSVPGWCAALVLSVGCGAETVRPDVPADIGQKQLAQYEGTRDDEPECDAATEADAGVHAEPDVAALCEDTGADVDCAFIEDAGAGVSYTARVTGHLFLTGLDVWKNRVAGQLTLQTKRSGDPAVDTRTIEVRGTATDEKSLHSPDDAPLQLQAIGVPGSSIRFALHNVPEGPGTRSLVSINGRDYRTRCESAGVQLHLPTGTDLIVYGGGSVVFSPVQNERWQIEVLLHNAGSAPLSFGAPSRIQLAVQKPSSDPWQQPPPVTLRATSLVDFDSGATVVSELAPGQVVKAVFPLLATDFRRCQPLKLRVDPLQELQANSFDPYLNDETTAPAPCLTWTTGPITAATLGSKEVWDKIPAAVQQNFGSYYASLQAIVSSQIVGRGDGRLCSQCHNRNSGAPYMYRPGVPSNTSSVDIRSDLTIGANSWADIIDRRGWAVQFMARPTTDPNLPSTPEQQAFGGYKPTFLKELFARWIADGRRADPSSPPAPVTVQ